MDLEMQCGSNETSGVIERAKEELEILELQYPNKFEQLKTELKEFISQFEEQLLLNKTFMSATTCLPAATQESSSSRRKKRTRVDCVIEDEGSTSKRRCKTDVVLERAHQCLRKIQNFKNTIYS